MTRNLHKLKAINVNRAKKVGRHSDGGGLYLVVTKGGSKSWVYMWSRKTGTSHKTGKPVVKRYEMGLGSFPGFSLSKARERAQECRAQLEGGLNPITEGKKNIAKSFGDVADEFIDSIKSEWSNAKHEYQWKQSLGTYCAPIRSMPIADVNTEDVLRVLKLIWEEKRETATRVRSRIERVIDYANAKRWREGENPARWKGHLKNILPSKRREEKKHYSAMRYDCVHNLWPNFVTAMHWQPKL